MEYKEGATRRIGIYERTWKTPRNAITYLAVFALAISAVWYAVVHERLLSNVPLHKFTSSLHLHRPFIVGTSIPCSTATPPTQNYSTTLLCDSRRVQIAEASIVCPTATPDALEPISGLLAPPFVWSRSYYDLVRMDNGHVPMSYFLPDSSELAAPGSLAVYFGELQGWVWVRTGTHRGKPNDIEQFARTVLPNVTRPIKLISSDGDSSVPGDLAPGVADAILNHPHVTVWYTQNYDGSLTHSKLKPLPIGLDLHFDHERYVFTNRWDEKLAVLLEAAANAPQPATRQATVLCDVLAITHPNRQAMKKVLQKVSHVHFTKEHVNFTTAMRTYSQYRFATSPRGNGIDCHRTWELLMLRTIPIVLSSSIDPLYKGLPVVIVKAWDEVADSRNLQRWYDEHAIKLERSGTTWLNRARWLNMSPHADDE